MNLKQVRAFIEPFARNYGLVVRWHPHIETCKDKYPATGWYHPNFKYINLRKVKNARQATALLSTFFHELQHHLNHLKGRPYNHHPAHRTDLAEEFYTDRLAALHMKKVFPDINYVYGYSDKTVSSMLAEEEAWERKIIEKKHKESLKSVKASKSEKQFRWRLNRDTTNLFRRTGKWTSKMESIIKSGTLIEYDLVQSWKKNQLLKENIVLDW